jgi:hypothetical protein
MEFFRYSSTSAILHTYELIAFISQAVLITELQPKPLMNLQSTSFSNQYEHIQITNYETRPIQLAHLFMRGFETMIFANEVCGAPIHPKYCCPSHFFNGKLFHQKYLQAQYYQQNQDLILILTDGNVREEQIDSEYIYIFNFRHIVLKLSRIYSMLYLIEHRIITFIIHQCNSNINIQ